MEKYGLLTFIAEAGTNKHSKLLWRLRCDCGKETIAIASAVRTGRTQSCGHLKSAGNRRTHGLHDTQVYTAWCNMIARCTNEKFPAYHNYGGRGITVCALWLASFEKFFEDMGHPPTTAHTLDRRDNKKGYSAENCRWVSRRVQSLNSRQNVWVEIDGVRKCISDWCEEHGIQLASVYRRTAKGEDMVSAITRPKAKRFLKGA